MDEQNREWKRKSPGSQSEAGERGLHSTISSSPVWSSLKNIAERYDGYGNSIRRVMEQKSRNAGILGVVSDLIQVDKKYETAIGDSTRRKYPEHRDRGRGDGKTDDLLLKAEPGTDGRRFCR